MGETTIVVIDAGQKLAGRLAKRGCYFRKRRVRGETFDSQSPVLFPIASKFLLLPAVRPAINDTRFPVVVGLRREEAKELSRNFGGVCPHRNRRLISRPPGKTGRLPLFFRAILSGSCAVIQFLYRSSGCSALRRCLGSFGPRTMRTLLCSANSRATRPHRSALVGSAI
jgi:hypothetical protein